MRPFPALLIITFSFVLGLDAKVFFSPPTITPAPSKEPHRRTLHKRARWVDVCPEGSKEGCQVIGVDQVLTEPEGHFIPACNDKGDCKYIGYVDPTTSISGTTSYIITSAGGDPFIVPVPILPPEAVPPLPPVPPPEAPEDLPEPPTEPEPEDPDHEDPEPTKTTKKSGTSACSLVSDTSAVTTASVKAQLNSDWLSSVASGWGSTITWFLDFDTSARPTGPTDPLVAPVAGQAPNCRPYGLAWYSPTSWCECSRSTFPTLSSTKGQTEARCNYRTLPASQITPSMTTTPPTNIPGVNGVPGCAYMVNHNGQACPNANYCDCGGTPAPPLTDGTSTHCNYATVPKSHCPPPTTTVAPPAPTGTISCFTSVAIATASVNDLIDTFCKGEAGYYAIGDPKINEAQPTVAKHDIPGESRDKMNNVEARFYVDRKGCKNAEFDIAKSTAVCSSYMAQITQSCSKDGGVIQSAGCFDWEVSGFIAGCPDCVD